MEEITIQEIQKKFEDLSINLKWAIKSAKIDENITNIGKNYGLNIEQLGQLSLETYMVVLDYIHPNKFEESLKSSLNLPDEKNKNIVVEINDKILKKIKENLMSSSRSQIEEKENIPEQLTEEKAIEESVKNEPMSKTVFDNKELENKKIMESVSSQKLSGSFKIPTIRTEYSLNNISKDKEKAGLSVNKTILATSGTTPQPTLSSYPVKEDPYRLKPE
jgi:hypothetical protein